MHAVSSANILVLGLIIMDWIIMELYLGIIYEINVIKELWGLFMRLMLLRNYEDYLWD